MVIEKDFDPYKLSVAITLSEIKNFGFNKKTCEYHTSGDGQYVLYTIKIKAGL